MAFNMKQHRMASIEPMVNITISFHPDFVRLFVDEDGQFDPDAFEDFIECLSDDEKGIMDSSCQDLGALVALKSHVESDVDCTAKDLEMER
jgi:hypothetical protein